MMYIGRVHSHLHFFSNSKSTTILKYNEAYYMLQVRVFPAFRLLSSALCFTSCMCLCDTVVNSHTEMK